MYMFIVHASCAIVKLQYAKKMQKDITILIIIMTNVGSIIRRLS